MQDLINKLALLIVVFGIVNFVLALLQSRKVGEAIIMMLDLLIAAELMRLSGLESWIAILKVAAVILLRRLIASSLTKGRLISKQIQ